jgi:intracellular multiplication protein IcmK
MANKIVFTWLHIAGGVIAISVSPLALSAVPLKLADASAPGTVVTTTTSTSTNPNPTTVASDQFQQWLQNGSNVPPPNMPTATAPPSSQVAPLPPLPVEVDKTKLTPLTLEQEQQIMLDSAPQSKISSVPDSSTAFNAMLQQNMPLTPQQVVKLRQQIDISQRASAITPNIPPKPVSTTLMINLAPGTTPPAIRLAQGYVSSLVFVDSTGAPWPIAAFDIGNPKTVNLQWDGKSNIILIQAITPYSNGNMVVRLVGLATPVTLEIVAGQRVVDYRVDIHVSGIGPNTKDLPVGIALPNSANQLLLGVLDGVSPPGSKQLMVRGADAQAWLLGQTMYLRTRLTVLSPGWVSTMVSPDGMHAYELPRTSSVLVSRYGEPAELKIEGL